MSSSDLAFEIAAIRLVDTHEHLQPAGAWRENGPDILQDLFGHYAWHDLVSAGLQPDALERLLNPASGSITARFNDIREAWERTQFAGYGEAIRLSAHHTYGIDEITAEALEAAQPIVASLQNDAERLRLMREVALLDHVQIDDMQWNRVPEPLSPEFFTYDLSMWSFCRGEIENEKIAAETGVTVTDLDSLRNAIASIFLKNAPHSIAVKSQHAYDRSLAWEERTEAEATHALQAVLRDGGTSIDRAVLGDWCWARSIEHAIEYGLPFKVHTGMFARNGRMTIDWVRPGHLTKLLARYPEARFVLMHIGYPYGDELISIAKHYANVWVDLCWAWSIDPYSSSDFVRRFIHAAPVNKLFAYGGDTMWPTNVLAYSLQARRWLTKTLEAEVAAGDLTEKQAITIAERIMRRNQFECFDLL